MTSYTDASTAAPCRVGVLLNCVDTVIDVGGVCVQLNKVVRCYIDFCAVFFI